MRCEEDGKGWRGRRRWALGRVGLRAPVRGFARGVRRVRVRAVAAMADEVDIAIECIQVCFVDKLSLRKRVEVYVEGDDEVRSCLNRSRLI